MEVSVIKSDSCSKCTLCESMIYDYKYEWNKDRIYLHNDLIHYPWDQEKTIKHCCIHMTWKRSTVTSRIEKATLKQLQLAVAMNLLDNFLSLSFNCSFNPCILFFLHWEKQCKTFIFRFLKRAIIHLSLKKVSVLCTMSSCSFAEKF